VQAHEAGDGAAARELGDTLGVQLLDIRQEENERLAERSKTRLGKPTQACASVAEACEP
jgi:hypothetical protein